MVYVVCKVPRGHLFIRCFSLTMFFIVALQVGMWISRVTREPVGQLKILHLVRGILIIVLYGLIYVLYEITLCIIGHEIRTSNACLLVDDFYELFYLSVFTPFCTLYVLKCYIMLLIFHCWFGKSLS